MVEEARDTIFSVRVIESQPVSIFFSVSFLIIAIGRLNRKKKTIKIHAFHTPISKTGIRSMIIVKASEYFSVANQLRELKGNQKLLYFM